MPEWLLQIILATIAATVAWIVARHGRLARLETRVATAEAINRRMWVHLRQQIDHAYRHGVKPLPIPEDIFGDD